MKIVGIALAAALCVPAALAWGPTGHRVVAEIAQRNLTPVAQARVTAALGGRTLAEVANWPDELRASPSFDKYKRLHYATVPNGVQLYQDSKKESCGDLVAAIGALSAYLKTGSRSALATVPALADTPDGTCNDRQTDPINEDTGLRLLTHFMGDLHQPLHVGGLDRGGNAVLVSWMAKWQSNLHSSWDDEMVDFERLSFTEFASFLNRANAAETASYQKGEVPDWANEAIAMRPALYVFPDQAKDSKVPLVSYGYASAQRERMHAQLLKGGLRLAAVLNRIYEP